MGGLLVSVGGDVPQHTGGAEYVRLVGAEDPNALVDDLERDLTLAELGTGCKRDDRVGLTGNDAGQVGSSLWDVVGEVVGDGQARPAGLNCHRAVDVLLAQRQGCASRPDREVAGPGSAEKVCEDGR